MARVSVVIPVKDDERILECVQSVLALGAEASELQVIVVNNCSPSSFQSTLSSLPGGVMVLDEPKPGSYAARNTGIAAAAGEVIFFTDADAIARPGWIAEGLRAVAEGGDLVTGDWGSAGKSKLDRVLQERQRRWALRHRRGDIVPTNTRNLAVRSSVFERMKFDERFARGADSAFGNIAREGGFRVFYAPAMRVDHHHDRDLGLFAAKNVCWAWRTCHVALEHPGQGQPGRLAPFLAGIERWTSLPAPRWGATACWWIALGLARVLQPLMPVLPLRVSFGVLREVGRFAWLSGLLLSASGRATQPAPSELLGRRLRRD